MKLRLIKYFFPPLLLVFFLSGQAQISMFEDIKSSVKHSPKLYANFSTRNSFITNKIAKIRSLKIGVTYQKQFTLALGYNWLHSTFEKSFDGNTAQLKMRYFTPFAEYSFAEYKNFQATIPVHLGLGWSFYQDDQDRIHRRSFILLYEPAMTLTYRFLKYFGAGAGIGFRLVLAGNKKIGENLNSPVYTLRLKVFLGDLYRDLVKKE